MTLDRINQAMTDSIETRASSTDNRNRQRLKEACQGFEAIFLNTLLKSMRATVSDDSLFGESHGMDIYRSMQDQALADEISRGSNNSGLGELLYKSLQDSVKT